MSTTFFHGTRRQALDIVDGMDLCLAPEREVAEAYDASNLFEVVVSSDARIADESYAWAVAEELDEVWEMDHYDAQDWRRQYFFEIVDRDDVREALAEAGFDAVAYDDLSPDNEVEHRTLRVWSASIIETVNKL